MKLDNLQLNFLNQLSSEIIILDVGLNVIWLNDSALNKGWVLNNKEKYLVTDQFSDESKSNLSNFLKKQLEMKAQKQREISN